MTDRRTASTITDAQLDALYAERDELRAELTATVDTAAASIWERLGGDALTRIGAAQRIHSHGRRTNTCNECGTPWPCTTAAVLQPADAASAALDGAQQPEPARQDGHTSACEATTAPGDPEPAEHANGPQAGVQRLDYPDAAANAEAENAWRRGEDHL